MTEFFGHTLAAMKDQDIPYSISLHGTLHLTNASLATFAEGKTYLYVKVYDFESERTHLIASLIPVVHEFVSLNLFFTAKQTVSFVLLGPNAVSISGMIERAVAQEEDEVAQLSNDFISSRLGFGSELSPEQEALAMELFGGGGPGNEQVEAEEELLEEALVFDGEGLEEQQIAEEKTKKKKKNKKKKNKAEKTDENGEALEPERKSRKIDRDTAMCVSESARRKVVASLTKEWAQPVVEGSSARTVFWTSGARGGAAVALGSALRLHSARVLVSSRAQPGAALLATGGRGAAPRVGLGLLPSALEEGLVALTRGAKRIVWLARSQLVGGDEQRLRDALALEKDLILPAHDADIYIELILQ